MNRYISKHKWAGSFKQKINNYFYIKYILKYKYQVVFSQLNLNDFHSTNDIIFFIFLHNIIFCLNLFLIQLPT